MSEKLLNYKLTEAKAELVKGEQSQSAIVNQEAKENITNTITVDEVKELDKRNDNKQDIDIAEVKAELEKKSTIYEVSNIKSISETILSKLKAGDVVQKLDSTGKHSYIVSFKKDGTGLCLTYTDASIVETQSYDYSDGHWVYNSQDVSTVGCDRGIDVDEIDFTSDVGNGENQIPGRDYEVVSQEEFDRCLSLAKSFAKRGYMINEDGELLMLVLAKKIENSFQFQFGGYPYPVQILEFNPTSLKMANFMQEL